MPVTKWVELSGRGLKFQVVHVYRLVSMAHQTAAEEELLLAPGLGTLVLALQWICDPWGGTKMFPRTLRYSILRDKRKGRV